MSQLEERIKPLIGSMMHDVSTPLDSTQQADIARWAVKTAIVSESTKPKGKARCYPPLACEALRKDATIPQRTIVWVGRSVQSGLHVTGTDLWPGVGKRPAFVHGCVTTLVVGHLLLQVVSFHTPHVSDNESMSIHCKDGPWDSLLTSVWPIRPQTMWPPKESVTTKLGPFSLHAVIDRWRMGTELRIDAVSTPPG